MNINRVSATQSNGGAVDRKTVGTALIAAGAVTSGVWNLGSTIHTLVAAPVVSLCTLGTATAAAGTGAYVYLKKDGKPAAKQTVDTTACAAA